MWSIKKEEALLDPLFRAFTANQRVTIFDEILYHTVIQYSMNLRKAEDLMALSV